MFEDLVPSPRVEASAPPAGMFDDLIPAADAPSAAAPDDSAGSIPPKAENPRSASDAAGATPSIPRLVGEVFGFGPVMDLLDPGVLRRGWEGAKQGFGSEPIGFSDENRRNHLVYRTWQPVVAPLDAALRFPGAIVGGAAGLGAGMYRAHGGGKAESDRLERDLNILGQGALIESGMGPTHTRAVLDSRGRSVAEIANLAGDTVKPRAEIDVIGDRKSAPEGQEQRALASARPLGAAPRELPELHEGAVITGDGPHGPIIDGYQGRWADAVDWLRRAQTGDASGVLEHAQVPGRIDVVWGDDRYGLAHIVAEHPEIIEDFPNLLVGMRRVESAVPGRIELSDGEHTAVISRDWMGEPKTWLLTAFRRRNEDEVGPGGRPGFRPATDLRSSLSRYYGEEGAGSDNVGGPTSDDKFESAPAPQLLSHQQIAENQVKIGDFLTRVGIPPDRVGPTEIDAVARSMGSLPLPDAIKRAAVRNALEGGVVSADEVDWIYGPGAADAVRGTPTPANGPVDPAQGRAHGQSAPHVAQGQPVPRPGEGGGETSGEPNASPGDSQPPNLEKSRSETMAIPPDGNGNSVGSAKREPDGPAGPRSIADPNNADRPEETVRPDQITAEDEAAARGENGGREEPDSRPPLPGQPPEPPQHPPVAARLTGEELGPATDLKHLRALALQYARENLVGRVITNRATGFPITINSSGMKKATSEGHNHDLLRMVPAVPDMIEHGHWLAMMPDMFGRTAIQAIHTFHSAVELGGRRFDTIFFVRQTRDGRFFYDYGMKRGDTEMRSGQGR